MEGSSTSISSWDRLLKMWFSNTLRLVEKCTWHMEQCIVTQSCQCLVVSAGCAARALSWSMHTKPQIHGKTGVWSSACEQSLGVSQAGWMFSAHFQPFLQYVRMGCRSTLKGMQWLERNLSKLTPLWAVTVLYFAVWHNCILTLHAKKKKTRHSTGGNVWEIYICWTSEILNGLESLQAFICQWNCLLILELSGIFLLMKTHALESTGV